MGFPFIHSVHRCFFCCLAALLLLSGCTTIEIPLHETKSDQVSLISDKENTVFKVSKLGLDQWVAYGPGKFVTMKLDPACKYEIRAKPPGYVEKIHVLSQLVREVRFTFMIEDKEPTDAAPVEAPPQ